MGNYFLMSRRFNKTDAKDFGLIETEDGIAICPKDQTQWKRTILYDFGWGKEIGYCKLPIPCFEELFNIAIYSNCEDDVYGAAAVILDCYPTILLEKCESFFPDKLPQKDLVKMIRLFNLDTPFNRSPIINKSLNLIQTEAKRWAALSEIAKNYMLDTRKG